MANGHENPGWLLEILGAMGIGGTGLGAWLLRLWGRQARVEQKIDDLKDEIYHEREDVRAHISYVRGRFDKIDDSFERLRERISIER